LKGSTEVMQVFLSVGHVVNFMTWILRHRHWQAAERNTGPCSRSCLFDLRCSFLNVGVPFRTLVSCFAEKTLKRSVYMLTTERIFSTLNTETVFRKPSQNAGVQRRQVFLSLLELTSADKVHSVIRRWMNEVGTADFCSGRSLECMHNDCLLCCWGTLMHKRDVYYATRTMHDVCNLIRTLEVVQLNYSTWPILTCIPSAFLSIQQLHLFLG
jgi:hypothetical protein